MSKPVNLNRYRKQKTRDAKRAEGDVNAMKYGRSKATKSLEVARAEKAERDHDGHRKE